jgi:hypothetical protein
MHSSRSKSQPRFVILLAVVMLATLVGVGSARSASATGTLALLHGTIFDSSGNPAGGVGVSVSGPSSVSTTTAADGTYSASVLLGNYLLGLTVTTGPVPYDGSTNAGITVSQSTQEDLALPGIGTASVHVVGAGGLPLAGASVAASWATGVPSSTAQGTTVYWQPDASLPDPPCVPESTGVCTFQGVAGNVYSYLVSPPVGVSASGVVTTTAAGGSVTVPIATDAPVVHGTVRDSQGTAVAGAGVQLDVGSGQDSTMTAGDGTYSLIGPAGPAQLHISPPSGFVYDATISFVQAAQGTAEDLVLPSEGTATVTVLDSGGDPLPGDHTEVDGSSPVTATNPQGAPVSFDSKVSSGSNPPSPIFPTNSPDPHPVPCVTDTNGQCVYHALVGSDLQIAEVTYGNGVTLTATSQGTAATIQTTAPATKLIHGTIQDSLGAPMAGASVEMRNYTTNAIITTVTAADGSYSTRVPPGTWQMTITPASGPLFEIGTTSGFLVTQDAREDIVVPLGTATVQVVDPGAHPISGASVALTDAAPLQGQTQQGLSISYYPTPFWSGAPNPQPPCLTDALGNCVITQLAGTTFQYTVTPPVGVSVSGALTPSAAGNSITVPIATDAPTVHGTVQDSLGNPVPGATVQLDVGSGQASTTTGADGTYSLVGPAGSDQLNVQIYGRAGSIGSAFTYNATLAFLQGAGGTIEDIVLPAEGTVTVTFVDAGGAPIPGLRTDVSNSDPVVGTNPQGAQITFGANVSTGSGPPSPVNMEFSRDAMPHPIFCTTDANGQCVFHSLAGSTLDVANQSGDVNGPVTASVSGASTTFQDQSFANLGSAGAVSGQVHVSSSPGASLSSVAVQPVAASQLPVGDVPVVGGLSYDVSGIGIGGSTDVVVQLPAGSAATGACKLTGSTCTDVSSAVTISGDIMTIHLTDGGPLDQDGIANGIIVDPIVPFRLSATVTATSSAGTSAFGQSITLTATSIDPSTPSSGLSGTMTFFDGAISLGSVPVVKGVASKVTAALSAGDHSITAIYSRGASYPPVTSAPLVQHVNRAATTTVVSSSAATSVYGQSVAFSASVKTFLPSLGLVTGGTVDFFDNGVPIGTASVVAGTAKVISQGTHALKDLGANPITARYNASSNFVGSITATPFVQTVTKASTITAVSSSVTTPVFGQPVTIRAAVKPQAPSTIAVGVSATDALGYVTFFDNRVQIGVPVLVKSGIAAMPATKALSVGTHTITASYDGSTNQWPSLAAAVTLVVHPANTRVTVTASVPAPVTGQSITYVATIRAVAPGTGIPTGTVTFSDASGVLATGVPIDALGKALLHLAPLHTGLESITASYDGDGNYNPATSAVLLRTINPAATKVSLCQTPCPPSAAGQPVTLNATVSVPTPGGGIPTGTVSFYDGTVLIATVDLDASRVGHAAVILPAGLHKITAVYNGSTDYKTSTSAALSLAVN